MQPGYLSNQIDPYAKIFLIILTTLIFSCSKNDYDLNDMPLPENPNTSNNPAKEEKDIAYGNHSLQKMDIYFPAGYTVNTPVVFLLHGGGFYSGDKGLFMKQVDLFKAEGFIVVNANYRLVDGTGLDKQPPQHLVSEIKLYDAVQDMDMAVNKFKSIADTLGAGTTKMFMAGHSAGAITSMLYVQGDLNKDKDIKASGNWGGTSDIGMPDGVQPTDVYVGPSSVTDFYKELLFRWTGKEPIAENALYYMAISAYWSANRNGGMPNVSVMPEKNDEFPFFYINPQYGTIKHVKNFHTLLTNNKVPNQLLTIAGEHHEFNDKANSWQTAIKTTADFFKKL